MSLLMEALKKAEQDKGSSPGGSANGNTHDLPSPPELLQRTHETPELSALDSDADTRSPELQEKLPDNHPVSDNPTASAPELTLEPPPAQDLDLDLPDDFELDTSADAAAPEHVTDNAPDTPAIELPVATPPLMATAPHAQSRRYLWWSSGIALAVLLGIGAYLYTQWQLSGIGGIAAPPAQIPQPIALQPEETTTTPAQPMVPETSDPTPVAETAEPMPAPAETAIAPTPAPPPTKVAPPPAPKAEQPAQTPPAKPATPAATPKTTPLNIVREQREDPLYRSLNLAYTAYQAGQLADAEHHYANALARQQDNRDALLGLAAIAQRRGDIEQAQRHYNHLLSLNPKDSNAISGLLSLRTGAAPLENESRLKLLLDEEPEAAHLHFALGTQYVAQNRWPEAQQAFFDAYRHAPDNADYAYNLAVSLDRLGQPNAALPYYQKALRQADRQPVSFDRIALTRRLTRLTRNGNAP